MDEIRPASARGRDDALDGEDDSAAGAGPMRSERRLAHERLVRVGVE